MNLESEVKVLASLVLLERGLHSSLSLALLPLLYPDRTSALRCEDCENTPSGRCPDMSASAGRRARPNNDIRGEPTPQKEVAPELSVPRNSIRPKCFL